MKEDCVLLVLMREDTLLASVDAVDQWDVYTVTMRGGKLETSLSCLRFN